MAFFCYIAGVFYASIFKCLYFANGPRMVYFKENVFYNVTRCKQELCQEYTKALNVTVKTKVRLRFYMLASSCHRLSCSVVKCSLAVQD